MKKGIFISILVTFFVIDIYTLYLSIPDLLFPKTTITVTNQKEHIIKQIKKSFGLNYKINKIEFYSSFPDGFVLDIYDTNGTKHSLFDDPPPPPSNIEENTIYYYFLNKQPDFPKYLKLFILEVTLEFLIIVYIINKSLKSSRYKK